MNRDRMGEKEKRKRREWNTEEERRMDGLWNFISLSWFRRERDFPFHDLACWLETYYDNFYQFVYQLVLSLHSLRTMAKYRWSQPPQKKKFVSNDELKRIGKFKKTCVLRVSQRTMRSNRSFRDITYTVSVGLFSRRGVPFHDNFAAYWAVMTLTPAGGAIKSRSPYRGIVRTGYGRRIIAIFFCLPVQQRLHTRFYVITLRQFRDEVYITVHCLSGRKGRTYGTLNRDEAVKSKFWATFMTSYKRTLPVIKSSKVLIILGPNVSFRPLKIQLERWHLNLLKVRSLRRVPNGGSTLLQIVHIAKPSVVSEAKSSSLRFYKSIICIYISSIPTSHSK